MTEKYARSGLKDQPESKGENKIVEENKLLAVQREKIPEEQKEIFESNNVQLQKKVSNEKLRNLKERIVEDVDGEKQKDLKKMVDNMIGVILSLKLSGDLNMTENRYLTDLHNHIFEGNSEEFHEINTVLLNICSK